VVARVQHGVEDRAIGLAEVTDLLPPGHSDAALASAALMELGAVVCTARSPRCGTCPVVAECKWKQLGSPQPEKPFRRPQSYAGTDRQVRGLLLAVLRESAAPVPRHRLDLVWPDGVQRERALQSLLTDGLVQAQSGDVFLLPDSTPAQ
jgi:A/G-specific adenine glycosylase